MTQALIEHQPTAAPRHTVRPASLRSNVLVAVLLILTMALAGYFRFVGLNWDDYVRFHPDERFLTNTASKIAQGQLVFTPFEQDYTQRQACNAQYPDTNGVGGYFDAKCSDLNPHNVGEGMYVYGTLPLFTARGLGELANQVFQTTHWTSYSGIHLVWRAMSAFSDALTVLVVFLIGVRLYGRWAGLLAAFLYACAVLPIQIAHFGTADAMTTFWVALTLLFSVRIQSRPRGYDYVLVGVAFGAALASRANIAPLVLSIIFAACVQMLPFLDTRLPWSERNRALTTHFGGLVLAGFMTILVFRIFNPYAFVGPGFFGLMPNERWLQDLGQARYLTSPEWEGPPAWQWVGRPAYVYALSNMILWGMGIALGVMGWLGWTLAGWQWVRGHLDSLKNAPLFLWVLVYFGWVGGNHVMSMRYYLPLYPVFALFTAWLLLTLYQRATQIERPTARRLWQGGAVALTVAVAGFTLLWAVMFTNIYRHQATFVQASHWIWENLPGDFAMRIDGSDPETVPLINIALPNSGEARNNAYQRSTRIESGQRMAYHFYAPIDGTVSSIHAPRIGSFNDPGTTASLRITISSITNNQLLADQLFTQDFTYEGQQVGIPYDIPLDAPLALKAGERYEFAIEHISGGTVLTGGTFLASEGGWDEAVPADVCTLPPGVTYASDPPPGLLSIQDCNHRAAWRSLLVTYELDIYREDDEAKREDMINVLDHTDYIMIPTNRRYDTHSRIPIRWPMTNRYYDALFSGELGFELVAEFQETFELGDLKISDQHLPTYDAPDWLNEFEAEEAFHVYDHPVVMLYRKTDAYSPEKTREILYNVSLNRPWGLGFSYDDPTLIGPVTWSVAQAVNAPTQLMFTEEMKAIQYNNGTWSDRFDRESVVNTEPVISVIIWWLTVMALGWIAFPLVSVALYGLADRGYAMAKFIGVLLVAWLGWIAGSSRLALWSPEGLRFIMLLLALVSVGVAWKTRDRLLPFIREKFRLLLIIEVLTLILFLVLLSVRLMNPDLWTIGFGGEKPMDFAYFNGVLRSTIFPPIDPWYVDGYINYYYFGFVIVGAPTLITGIIPATAYNLILPMLFAMTGIAAFSVAFSLVHSWQERREVGAGLAVKKRLGSPYFAGVLAILLAVFFGNLDTPRVVLTGIANAGGYHDIGSFEQFMIDEYRNELGYDLYFDDERITNPGVGERLRYEFTLAGNVASSLFRGTANLLMGNATLAISPDRWFWAPSRIITETVGGGAITEMPYFTFLYGDLHGHMIAMPLMLFIIGAVFNEVIQAGRENRRFWGRLWALGLIALAVGVTIAVNSWDYPTFMLFTVLGLGYCWWLAWRRINRWSLMSLAFRIGTFVALSYLVALPYRTWYAATYTSIHIWDGTQTPLWAYLSIHGLFLFLVISLLIWETARWLRNVKVRALRGKQTLLISAAAAAGLILFAAVIATLEDYHAALIVLPLIAWIGVLFFRPGQSSTMQFVLVLIGLALAITLGVEVVVLSGDSARQNTVFKFYIQVWLLFSVAGAAALAWLFQSSDEWHPTLRLLWYVPLMLLIFVSALFPVMATQAKAQYRLPPRHITEALPPTLAGDAFMKYTNSYYESYETELDLNVDYEIIHWLQDNLVGSPTIAEGISFSPLYYWGGRISIHTGLPSIVGWDWHQKQQRTFDPLPTLVAQRIANLNNLYTTPDREQAWRILRNYNVSYVVVGALETSRYAPLGGLDKFDEMVDLGWLEVVFETPSTPTTRLQPDGSIIEVPRLPGKIYRVNKDAAPDVYIAELPQELPLDNIIGD